MALVKEPGPLQGPGNGPSKEPGPLQGPVNGPGSTKGPCNGPSNGPGSSTRAVTALSKKRTLLRPYGPL